MNRVHSWIKVLSTWCVAVLCACAFGQAAAVSGAISTTTNLSVDTSAGQCLNGPDGVDPVNCNIYSDKQYVWFSGLPVSAALGDGTYFFAVLVPGGQPSPNDAAVVPDDGTGTLKNLSDDFDAYTNRTFTVQGGIITSFTGGATHSWDQPNNKIRAFPYSDTTNDGGVYVLAVCSLANGVPVAASKCKYDAFKVNSGVQEEQEPLDLTIVKDADGSYTQPFSWAVQKSVDPPTVTILNDGSAVPKTKFTYTVTFTRTAGTVSDIAVDGTITVSNPNVNSDNSTAAVLADDVTDALSTGSFTCTVDKSGGLNLTQFQTDFPYSCTLSALPDPIGGLDNTTEVTWSTQPLSNGATLTGNSAQFTFDDIVFTANNVDDCINVSDTLSGSSVTGTICGSQTFTYSNLVDDPGLGQCATVNNTAGFITDDTGATGSAGATAKVCHYRAPLTMGYWKNHAANSNKNGANYSSDCSKLKSSSCSTNGKWTIQYLPQSLGGYSVTTIVLADPIWGAANCGASTDQGAIGCLAGQLLAAKLNLANGSCPGNPAIGSTVTNADALLVSVNYQGPNKTYSLNAAQRASAISLKTLLDSYNNGNSC